MRGLWHGVLLHAVVVGFSLAAVVLSPQPELSRPQNLKCLQTQKSFQRKAEAKEKQPEEAKHAHKSDSICCATACVNTKGEKRVFPRVAEGTNSNQSRVVVDEVDNLQASTGLG